MRKEQKTQEIKEIAEILSQYNTVYVADLTGMTVEKTNSLRRVCFRKGVKVRMVKNTLLKKAMERLDTDYSEMTLRAGDCSSPTISPMSSSRDFRLAKSSI